MAAGSDPGLSQVIQLFAVSDAFSEVSAAFFSHALETTASHSDEQRALEIVAGATEKRIVAAARGERLVTGGDGCVFMDQENYEQISLLADFLEGQAGYLLPNTEVQVNFYNGRPIGVELPPSAILTVAGTEPGIKNSTATNSFKPAKMETGITVQVPPFINSGEKIKIDTNEGKYMERA